MIDLFLALKSVLTIDWITNQLTNNDFLVAAIAAAGAFLMRSIPVRIWKFINRQITIEFTLTNEDDDYQEIVHFLENKRFKWFSRTYTKKNDRDFDYGYDENPTLNKPNTLTLGYGTSWFWFGCLGYISREFKESNHSNKLKEEVFIKLYSRNPTKIQSIIDEATKSKKISANTIPVYLANNSYWSLNSYTNKRTFDNVFVEDYIKDQIRTSLDNFIANRDWYYEKGIPYKFGIFIEGEPGSGKTSLLKAICTYLNRQMFFMTSTGLMENSISSLISDFCIRKDAVLILEELDTFDTIANRKKKKTDGTEQMDTGMSVVLNTLDGGLTPDNFIFIATTNYPEKIDAAIKRPGRFDLIIRVEKLSYSLFIKMVSHLYEIDQKIIDKDFKGVYKPLTGAEVQGTYILERDYLRAKNILIDKMKEDEINDNFVSDNRTLGSST